MSAKPKFIDKNLATQAISVGALGLGAWAMSSFGVTDPALLLAASTVAGLAGNRMASASDRNQADREWWSGLLANEDVARGVATAIQRVLEAEGGELATTLAPLAYARWVELAKAGAPFIAELQNSGVLAPLADHMADQPVTALDEGAWRAFILSLVADGDERQAIAGQHQPDHLATVLCQELIPAFLAVVAKDLEAKGGLYAKITLRFLSRIDQTTERTEAKVDEMKGMLERLIEAQAEKSKEAQAEGKTLADYTPEEVLADITRRIHSDLVTVRAVLEAALASNDLSTRAQALMIEQQFAEAAVLSRKAGDAKAKRLQDLQARTAALAEEAALDYHREGLAHFYQLQYPPAIDAYEIALTQVNRSGHPEIWANLQNSLAIALSKHGTETVPAVGNQLLARAITAFRAVQEVYLRISSPEEWSIAENNVANALREQGMRSEGQKSLNLLEEAIAAYRNTLKICTRQAHPRQWASTQSNLAGALRVAGSRSAGLAGTEFLLQAEIAALAALEIYSRESWPLDWAMIQSNLGNIFNNQAQRCEGNLRLALMSKAARAFRGALETITRSMDPLLYATLQNNLAIVLGDQGDLREGQSGLNLLEQAVVAFRLSLEVFTRETLPQQWAETQNNLAAALQAQGSRISGKVGLDLLQQAIAACRAALEVRTRNTLPQGWASTQNNLAIALKEYALRSQDEDDAALLGQAVIAYRNALTVHTRVALPYRWAMTQSNLGNALMAQGDKAVPMTEKQGFYREAEAAYQAALEVRTKVALPSDREQTQWNLDILRAKMAK